MLKKVWGLFLVLTVVTPANAEWELTTYSDEHYYFVDQERVRESTEYGKTYLKVWVKQVIYNDITKDGYGVGDYSLLLWQIDCNALTMGIKSYADYKKNGKMVYSTQAPFVKMNDAMPNSVGETFLNKACFSQ